MWNSRGKKTVNVSSCKRRKNGEKKRKINWQKLLARDERQSFKPSLLGVSWQMP